MATGTRTSDKGIGLAMLLSALALVGAVVMYIGAPEPTAGWGFAAAMVFAALAVAAVHLYWE